VHGTSCDKGAAGKNGQVTRAWWRQAVHGAQLQQSAAGKTDEISAWRRANSCMDQLRQSRTFQVSPAVHGWGCGTAWSQLRQTCCKQYKTGSQGSAWWRQTFTQTVVSKCSGFVETGSLRSWCGASGAGAWLHKHARTNQPDTNSWWLEGKQCIRPRCRQECSWPAQASVLPMVRNESTAPGNCDKDARR
jgi:hypothetical protein